MTTISADFNVAEVVRTWATDQYGYPHLPDIAITPFRRYHEKEKRQGRARDYDDWDLALMAFIRSVAPGGKRHDRMKWEAWIHSSTRLTLQEAANEPPQSMKGRHTPRSKAALETAKKLARRAL